MINRISASLSDADATAIASAITEMKSKMPFLMTVPKSDKKRKQKMGNNAISYVNKGLVNARNQINLLPRNFNVEEFEKDGALVVQLNQIRNSLTELTAKLNDTIEVLGEELMTQANLVYNTLQREAKNDNALKSNAAEMAEFYKRRNTPDEPSK